MSKTTQVQDPIMRQREREKKKTLKTRRIFFLHRGVYMVMDRHILSFFKETNNSTYSWLFALSLVLIRFGFDLLASLGLYRVVVKVGMLEELLTGPTFGRIHRHAALRSRLFNISFFASIKMLMYYYTFIKFNAFSDT